jgi:hypothetical protein
MAFKRSFTDPIPRKQEQRYAAKGIDAFHYATAGVAYGGNRDPGSVNLNPPAFGNYFASGASHSARPPSANIRSSTYSTTINTRTIRETPS